MTTSPLIDIPEGLFIGDGYVAPASGRTFASIDPATGGELARVAAAGPADVDAAVRAAQAALHGPWGRLAPDARAALLHRLADLVERDRERIATLETLDMGKPLRESYANVDRSIKTFRYYAGSCDKLQGDTIPVGAGGLNFTVLGPLGVTAHITPWNYPFANACRSLPPALACGNTVVVKPASVTSLSTLLLGELALEAGFPPGVVNVVTGSGREAGAALARHPLVRGITFTGSISTGSEIMRFAAEHVRPCVLELGGKNAQVVFADADLEHALAQTVRGAFTNAGQVCTSVSRLLVERSVHADYVAAVKDRLEALTVGPGLGSPDLGPLVSEDHRGDVEDHVARALAQGARLVTGGQRPAGFARGFYYEPTLFDHVDASMDLARDEVFGPVLAATPFDSDDEALRIANGVDVGLTSGVFTRDLDRAMHFARGIEAGMVWVNDWFASPVQAPHGGTKLSGLGREQGLLALQNYLQVKDVAIRMP